MKRALAVIVIVLAAAIVLPPVWFGIFPQPKPDLPPPGRRVAIGPTVGVNVLERGTGPVIVLVHGQPGCAYDWIPAMTQLAQRGFRVLAYDRVGYGRSDGRSNGDYTVNANAEELLGVLDAEDLHDVIVVGWSYGGGTAIVAARKDPSRMSRIVLVGSVGPGIDKRDAPPQFVIDFMRGPGLLWLSRVPPLNQRLRVALTKDAFYPDKITPGYLNQLAANFARPNTLYSFRHEGADLDGRVSLDTSTIMLPVLIVQGDSDQLVPASIAEELHRRTPGSELWMVEKGGHMLPITHAAALADRIAAFARPNANAVAAK